jgi:hypothetical protein
MQTEGTAKTELKKLAIEKETLRRLTPAELRLVAGGVGCQAGKHYPKTIIVA